MGIQPVNYKFTLLSDRNIKVIILNTSLTKTNILIYKYFVDENKYIFGGSCYVLPPTINNNNNNNNIAKIKYTYKHNTR